MKIRNTIIVFLVSGFWHGANWTFVFWGLLHAAYFLPLLIAGKNRVNLNIVAAGKYFPSVKEFLQMCATFCLATFAWIFFRAENLGQAANYISRIFSRQLFRFPEIAKVPDFLPVAVLVIVFILIEWFGREGRYALDLIDRKFSRPVRYAIYYLILIVIFWFGGREQQFIYFQF